MSDRDAPASYKGYAYQRLRLINLLFCDYYNKFKYDLTKLKFNEEKYEDIYINTITENGIEAVVLYQEKFLSTTCNESLTKDSGLTKVLISHYNNPSISEIKYEVIYTSDNKGETKILKSFLTLINDKLNKNLIGKFIYLNYKNPKKFYNLNYDKMIDTLKNTTSLNVDDFHTDKEENTNEYKLIQFCKYCCNIENTNALLDYCNKIKVDIRQSNFDELRNKTINSIKELLPEINEIFNNSMSESYKTFSGKILYGLFDMTLDDKLFKDSNNDMTFEYLINNVKQQFKNCMNDNDRMHTITHLIQHLIKTNKYNMTNDLISDDDFSTYIITRNITLSKFINGLNVTDENTNEYKQMIRVIIHNISSKLKYNICEDAALLGFLQRSHTGHLKLKLKKNNYSSLKGIDSKITNYKSNE